MSQTELVERYRPQRFSEMVGQDMAVAQLTAMIKKGEVAHALLLSGPSGVGKTTAARILKKALGCDDIDYSEINVASSRGIDTIRDVETRVGLSPMGRCRLTVFDECHRWTRDSQEAVLKILEDTSEECYYVLCSTDPQKLIPTVMTRCNQINFVKVSDKAIGDHLCRVVDAEKQKVAADVLEAIVSAADGSPRKALKILQQVMVLPPDQRLGGVEKSDHRYQAKQLGLALLNPKCTWKEVAAIIRDLDEDAEGLRRMVLAFAMNELLYKGTPRAYAILSSFEMDLYASGKPGLVAACWRVIKYKE